MSSAPTVDCLVFLDGELYRERVKAPEIVGEMEAKKELPPVSCVYVSNETATARHRDFTCNETYAEYAAKDVVKWIEQRLGRHDRYFLCGLSLSGLEAAFAVLRHPGVFTGALCQSPSAWWNEEWLVGSLRESGKREERFWVSVGNQELTQGVSHPPTGLMQGTSQLESVRRLTERMGRVGLCVRHEEFTGGHDPACWGRELPEALEWMMGADREAD